MQGGLSVRSHSLEQTLGLDCNAKFREGACGLLTSLGVSQILFSFLATQLISLHITFFNKLLIAS